MGCSPEVDKSEIHCYPKDKSEVVDHNLFRVAGTGMFSGKVNEDMSEEGYVYRQVLRTGRRQVIYEPGKEMICYACPQRDVCQEEIEISMPLRLGTRIIGVIGVVGSTREQKERILGDEALYMDFLEQIAVFIATKAREYTELEGKNALLGTLDCTIDHIDQGIMLLGSDYVVTTANISAKNQLELEGLEGSRVSVEPTGDHLNHLNEYKLRVREQEFYVMGHMYDLPNPSKRYAALLIFESSRNLQKKYYEMTSTVHTLDCDSIIGSSPQTLKMKEEILKVAQSSSTVLITGESGTGKEMVATAIWNASERRNGRFVAINCAAIPEALLESELFGYEKGAFTGAVARRIGKFEEASEGTLLLDEISEMDIGIQAKLLRAIQEKEIDRIGGKAPIKVNTRIIATSNRDLEAAVKNGTFRQDLYYRLNVISLNIPDLKDRPGDIIVLAKHFIKKYSELNDLPMKDLSAASEKALMSYDWPGNVRELENTMHRSVLMSTGDEVEVVLPESSHHEETAETPTVGQTVAGMERKLIIDTLKHTLGNRTTAANILGISIRTLRNKLKQYQEEGYDVPPATLG